jgi:hypothetical protein
MTPNEGGTISIGAAIRDGLTLKTVEVVALLHNACAQLDAGTAAALPRSIADLSVRDTGTVVLPQIAPTEPARATVAALLEELLPPEGNGPDTVPRALRTLPARLRESGDTQGSELKDLLTILRWHLPSDSREVLRDLVARAQLGATQPRMAAPSTVAAEPSHETTAPPPSVAAASVAAAPIAVPLAAPPVTTARTTTAPIATAPIKRPWRPQVADAVMTPVATSPGRSRRAWQRPVAATAAIMIAVGAAGYAGYRLTVDGARAAHPAASRAELEPGPPPTGRVLAADTVPEGDRPAAPKPAGSTHALDLPVSGGAFSPSFASSGSTLWFHAGHTTSGRLFQASLDPRGRASAVTPLLEEHGRTYHARPSPDGQWIAFDSDRDGERGVYLASRDGARIERVSGEGYAAVPSWSPDMKWLAFVRAEDGRPKVWNLWRREIATGTLVRDSAFKSGQVWGASWFPDGRSLCYSHDDRLFIATTGGGAAKSFASPIEGRLIRTPAVSPDGRQIVFQVYRDGAWLLDIDTGAMRRLLADPSAEEFAWDPKGTQIAYHSRRDGQWRIWMLSL